MWFFLFSEIGIYIWSMITNSFVGGLLGLQSNPPCGVPQFTGNWEKLPPYPLSISEAGGGMIGNDLVVFTGFIRRDNDEDIAIADVYALDVTTLPNSVWRRMDDMPLKLTHMAHALQLGTTLVHFCGGYLGDHPGSAIADCFTYDHSATPGNQWTTLPSLPAPRAGGGMFYDATTNSLIFGAGSVRPEIGNSFSIDYENTWVLYFDDINSGWIDKNQEPYSGNHVGYTTAYDENGNTRYFFIGGQYGDEGERGNLKDNEEWDTSNEIWIRHADSTVSRGHATSSTRAIGCGILSIGGSNNILGGAFRIISYYDIPTNTWRDIDKLPSRKNAPVCDIHDNYLYCVTGWPKDSNWSYRRKIEVK